MNRRPVLLCWAIALNAILFGSIGGAPAARLPTSTITINVLSVDRESVNREEIKHPGRPTVGFETAKFAAKAKITRVLASDHGLNAGDVIDIRYGVTVRQPPDPAFRARPALSAGQTVTATVSGGGNSFTWRN